MVLVDTSAWIRFLANKEPYSSELDKLLEMDDVAAHELVYGELLAGDNGGRREMLAAYERIRGIRSVPHAEVVQFVVSRRLHGRGIGWVNLHLLASALVARTPLWTADVRLAELAAELQIGYTIPSAVAGEIRS